MKYSKYIISTVVVLAVLILGYVYAQNKDDKKAEETKTEQAAQKEGKTAKAAEQKIEKFEVYTIGKPTYEADGEESKYIDYKIIESEEVPSLKKASIILVQEDDFYKNTSVFKEAVNDEKNVLVYSKKLDTSEIVGQFAIDDEVIGMDSTNGTYYQGYGYANIKGTIMPMVIAASTSVEDVTRSSIEELLKQIVKQNEAK